MLRPSGYVIVDGRDVAAVAEHGVMVAEGGEVEIVSASLGELLVRAVETESRT
jgi:membrane-bound ClpP family serine protease